MNAVVVYSEKDRARIQRDFGKIATLFRFLTLYGLEYEFVCNAPVKRGTHYDLAIVISREELPVKCGLYFRFERPSAGIASAVRRILDEKFSGYTAEFKLFGPEPEEIEEILGSIPKPPGLCVTYCSDGLDTAVYARSTDTDELQQFTLMLYQSAGKSIYSEKDESLEECAVSLLTFRKKMAAASESLTGGMVSARLVNVPGAGEVFYEGTVTYANEAKRERLAVAEETIAKYGAVSEAVAYEMCRGLLASGRVEFALSTTGIAGPGGGSAKKPVGTVYIGVANRDNILVYKHLFEGDRESVRNQSASWALFYLIKCVQNNLDYTGLKIK